MKTKPLPGSLAGLRWLTETRKNKAMIGIDVELSDIAEMLLAFMIPMAELEKMSEEEIKIETEKVMHGISAEDFHAMQFHAQSEIKKFTDSAVTPKKPLTLTDNPTLWERIKLAWSVFFPG
jgi:hypothetical protein